MKSHQKSTSHELPPQIRVIVEDIVATPLPEELRVRPDVLDKKKHGHRRGSRGFVAVIAVCVIVAFCTRSFFAVRPAIETANREEVITPAPDKPAIPKPTLWNYRKVSGSLEDLDALLSTHADQLLPHHDTETMSPFSRFHQEIL